MTRLADPLPPYCASCFNHKQIRHVDFEAAYDGPVIPGAPENQPVDDLTICEDCLAEAFALLDPQGLHQTIEALKGEVERLRSETLSKDKAINDLRYTVDELVRYPVRGTDGKPRLEGLPPDLKRSILDSRQPKSPGRQSQKNPKRVAAGKRAAEKVKARLEAEREKAAQDG